MSTRTFDNNERGAEMGDTRTIQSLDRAINILEIFRINAKELSVTEISNELQINKSTVFGLINTLANRGYLHQNPNNQKYSLGLSLLELGELVQRSNIIADKAKPFLEILVNKFNETVHLAIEEKGEVIYIDKLEGQKTIYISSRIGSQNPIHCTGVGKCLLAFMNVKRREKILEGFSELRKYTENTITNKFDLIKELDSIIQKGYSIDNEEFAVGLYCYSVPILNKYGEAIASISISGPTSSMKNLTKSEVINYIKKIANEISNRLR